MKIKPDNFHGDPLGYGGNFGGHVMLGLTAMFWFAFGWRVVFGELPDVWLCIGLWTAAYLAIELSQSGGKVLDTLDDIAVSTLYPAMLAIWASAVFAANPMFLNALVPIFGLYTAHAGAGIIVRLYQAQKEGHDL